MRITIGITDTEARYPNYPLWIKGDDDSIEIIQLTPENFEDIKKCDGIVLSGGIDTHPRFYNNQRTDYPVAPDKFREERDEFELEVFEYAKVKLPVLGICRGMQLVNVALKGDLIQDLEENKQLDHRRRNDADGIHEITAVKDSLLYQITQTEKGIVNSAHHQAIGVLADELMINSYSPDGVPEGAEWKNKIGKPFFLCIQWHPERLAQIQKDNPFTKNIRTSFLEAVKNNKQK